MHRYFLIFKSFITGAVSVLTIHSSNVVGVLGDGEERVDEETIGILVEVVAESGV